MRLVSLIKHADLKRITLLILFSFIFLFTRAPRLHNDINNPDGVNWHYRSQQFMNGLKYGDLEKTYQHYHPGVTLMWITGPAIELFRQFPGNDSYTIYNYSGFDFTVKFALVISHLVITLLILFFLSKLVGFYKGIVIVAIFSFEPFFVGNSRLYHLDILVSLLIFLAIVVSFLAYTKNSKSLFVAAGLVFSLAFLTKSVSLIFLAGTFAYFVSIAIFSNELKKHLYGFAILLAAFVAGVYALLPALWVRPIYYIQEIFKEGFRVGIRTGHEVVVMGDTLDTGGFSYYPLVLLLKVSPFILIGILLNLSYLREISKTTLRSFIAKITTPNFHVMLALLYVVYFLAMSFPAKKLDRYMLVEFPFLAVIALYGYIAIKKYISNSRLYALLVAVLFTFFVIWPLVRLFPYYFTYTSPIFGTPEQANKVIGQKPFGVGIYELKDYILKKYGNYPNIGFIDTKPMKSIYPNRLVHDMRDAPLSAYAIGILGPNEDFPDKIFRSSYKMEYDSSFTINGLEYWRIYVKRPK